MEFQVDLLNKWYHSGGHVVLHSTMSGKTVSMLETRLQSEWWILSAEYYFTREACLFFVSVSGLERILEISPSSIPTTSCAVHCPWEPCGPAAVDKAEWRLLALLVGRPAAAAPAVCIGNAANRATLCCLVWISDWNICEAEWCEKINVSAPTHSVSECECVDRGEEGRWGEINTWKKSQDCSAFQC